MPTLFLAEDDTLMVRMYARAFKTSGFDLKVSFDGEDAIKILKAMDPKPVAVILDIMMPKKSGFEVLKEMKEDTNLKSIPVIILTNLAGTQDEDTGMNLGADLYLVKSRYSPSETVIKVEEMIKNKK
jgi:DNA-binding response OmpR family regulator